MNKYEMYQQIMTRATTMGLMSHNDVLAAAMDLESADMKFDLQLDKLLAADGSDFIKEFCGIRNNINSESGFPATDFGAFVPQFANTTGEKCRDEVPEGFSDVFIYVPSAGQIVVIAEGTGDNLLPEDREEGYVDYILYYQHDLDTDLTEQDGGQIMTTQLVQEKYKRLADCIPDVLDMAYGNPHLEFVVLYNSAVRESIS